MKIPYEYPVVRVCTKLTRLGPQGVLRGAAHASYKQSGTGLKRSHGELTGVTRKLHGVARDYKGIWGYKGLQRAGAYGVTRGYEELGHRGLHGVTKSWGIGGYKGLRRAGA